MLAFCLALSSRLLAADEPTSTLKFEVVGGEDKTVENASVYVKWVEKRTLWKDKRVEWRLKTNRDGKAMVKEVPRGKILVQVIASGWKTYGKYYEVNQEEQTISIKLDRPRRWY